jgi:hypothetical protein
MSPVALDVANLRLLDTLCLSSGNEDKRKFASAGSH